MEDNESNKGFCGKLGNLLAKIDYFGVTFLFRVDKRDKYGSSTGGFWFLVYLIIALAYITFIVIDYFSGQNFIVSIIDKSQYPSPILNIGKNNFTIAMRLTFDNDSGINGTDVENLIQFSMNYVNITGGNKKKKTSFFGRPCVKNDFYQTSNDPLFQTRNFSDFMCFDGITSYDIFGIYTDPNSGYFEFLTFLNKDKVAQDYQAVEKLFKDNQFKLSFYHVDTLYDVSNNEKPVFYIINSIYTYIDLPFYKRNNINFQEFVYDLDKNIFTNNYKNSTYMKLYSKEEISVSMAERNTNTLDDRYNLAKFFIRGINYQKIVKRSYQKIPTVLANISGLLVNLLVIIGVVMTFLNLFKAKQHVMNGILKYKENIIDKNKDTLSYLNNSFNDPKIKKIIEESKKDKDVYQTKKSADISMEKEVKKTELEEVDIERIDLKERLNSISSKDSEKKKAHRPGRNPFNIGISDILCLIFCCRSIKKKQMIYENSESKFNYYMDIITYMKKMQEIDIIKYLLLDVDSLNLMNFISKPSVSLTKSQIETKEYKAFFNITEDAIGLTEQNINTLRKSYLNIISKPKISYLEHRMLELFDLQIKEILS